MPAHCLIKVDVEGFETRVLAGAVSTIKSLEPNLLIEVHPGKIATIDLGGTAAFIGLVGTISERIWMCRNHRGFHRGPVTPWELVSVKDAHAFIESGDWKEVGNFYLHLSTTSHPV